MRRRTRLAALPVHRHSLPQIVVDAGLVALAYYLAYRLRFDGGVPTDYQQLFEHTLSFVVIGSVTIFAGFGLYRKLLGHIDKCSPTDLLDDSGPRRVVGEI